MSNMFFSLLVYEFYFYVLPTEKYLLHWLWRKFQYYKPNKTPEVFLEEVLIFQESRFSDPRLREGKANVYRRFHYAIRDPSFLVSMVSFLQAEDISNDHLGKLEGMIRRATRFGISLEPSAKDGNRTDESKKEGENGALNSNGASNGATREEGMTPEKSAFFAKTYFIAAQLHFELAGEEAEYARLSVQLEELADFVQRQFGAGKLPGTFYDLKGYSYKSILTGKNQGKKGQLKPFLRQIIDNPQVFGQEISRRAKMILEENFT